LITTVNIEGKLLVPKVRGIEFQAQDEWLTREMDRCGIPSMDAIPPLSGRLGDVIIEREDGSHLTTLGDVVEAHLCPKNLGDPEWREYVFTEPAYIATSLVSMPRLLLRAVTASVELVVGYTQNVEVKLEPLVGLILKEVTGGSFEMFDSSGSPLVPGARRSGPDIVAEGELDPE